MKGGFTGALMDRPGPFEIADGGTVFLDEIGELPLEHQATLLRVLERGEVRRLGGNVIRRVDVRVIAATNRNLAHEVERGRFREDLYYRLAVIPVRMPPLRERPDDIPLLVRHFEALLAERYPSAEPLSDEAVEAFTTRPWHGNVRELRNAVEHALSLSPLLRPMSAHEHADAPAEGLSVDLTVELPTYLSNLRRVHEKAYILALLEKTCWNVTRAAEIAGVERKWIQRAMLEYGLRGASPKRGGPLN